MDNNLSTNTPSPESDPVLDYQRHDYKVAMPARSISIPPVLAMFIIAFLAAMAWAGIDFVSRDMPEGVYITIQAREANGIYQETFSGNEDEMTLTAGNSLEDIEQDIEQLVLDDAEEDLKEIENDMEKGGL